MAEAVVLDKQCSWCESYLLSNGETEYCEHCGWWDALPTKGEEDAKWKLFIENLNRKERIVR